MSAQYFVATCLFIIITNQSYTKFAKVRPMHILGECSIFHFSWSHMHFWKYLVFPAHWKVVIYKVYPSGLEVLHQQQKYHESILLVSANISLVTKGLCEIRTVVEM